MRSRFVVILALVLFPALSYGQRGKPWNSLPAEPEGATRAFPPQLRSELTQIRDAALQDDYPYQQLQHLTDSICPRPSASPHTHPAVHYVPAQLLHLGPPMHHTPPP